MRVFCIPGHFGGSDVTHLDTDKAGCAAGDLSLPSAARRVWRACRGRRPPAVTMSGNGGDGGKGRLLVEEESGGRC